jgi:4'-phosphopantetheinyl transferase
MRTIGESIHVWVVRLTGQTAENWRSILSIAEWEKAMRFRFPADQTRSAVTRGVLRTLLSRYLNCPASDLAFTENDHGKPAISGIEFNVSHSGDYSLLAFSRSSPIGVDVEHIKDRKVIHDLSRRILTPNEYERFNCVPDSDRQRVFHEIWTLKESILKAIGSGLSVAPESLEIAFHPDKPKLLSAETDLIKDVSDWSLHSLDIGDSAYTAAIAVRETHPTIQLNHF